MLTDRRLKKKHLILYYIYIKFWKIQTNVL